jgi:diphosphomevalonate decarboxylase
MTLSSPSVDIEVQKGSTFTVESFNSDGSKKDLSPKAIARFHKHHDLTNHYLKTLGDFSLTKDIGITVRSAIPSSIGLASSAAVFSCLARCYAGLMQESIELTDEQVSVIARLGSGSAARSVLGGFVALNAGEGNAIDSSSAEQIAPSTHWNLHDIIIVPSQKEKKVGSTEGHALAQTSPHFADRIEAIKTRRQQDCIDAILAHDFEKLQRTVEEDALDMHNVMETSDPPLHYLTEETHRIIQEISALRESKHIPVLFTMDAGPTVHLICTDEAHGSVVSFAHTKKGCQVFAAKVGEGASVGGE